MRGDSTRYSTVVMCRCGARFVAHTRELARAELERHEQLAGCNR